MISHLFLWWHRDRSATTSTLMRSWHDVDVTANDVEIQTFRSMTDCRSEKRWRVDDRIDIWLTQIRRCSWRKDVSTTSKKLTWRNVDKVDASNDVDTMQRPTTWRDVTSTVVMDWRRLRSDFMANPAKIFITIWFESYIVVSQAFWL